LEDHYKLEREGQDRLENLAELVNAAESFVTLEGFGRDAVALPVDELRQSPASQGLDLSQPVESAPALIADFETGETLSPLAAFLTHAALEAGDNQAKAGQDAVQLMTVHSSKGLEFDCVFIAGLEEGLFPHENAMNDAGGLEEERRLMYVAITRARKRLYLSHSQTRMLHGQTRYHVKSRFLAELPEAALKWLTPKNAGFAASLGGGNGWRGASNSGAGHARSDWAGGVFASKNNASERFPNPAVPAQREAPAHGLKTGTNVFHAKFGEGRVQMLEGSGDDARAQINFTRHGVKWLALGVAKLTVVNP
jgi:DNA helicase II / ATP-dependent DNA helicase PcrA